MAAPRQQFASDNNAGMCPEAMAALVEADAAGHAVGYGDDDWTRRAKDKISKLLEADCEVFFVFNGTAANALSLAHLCRPWNSVICTAVSHVDTDECGAPEFFSGGAKLLTAEGRDGKLAPADVERLAMRHAGVHHVKAAALSLTNATELGTVYTIDEMRALAATARKQGLKVHLDGARFANAVAHLGCAPADLSWRAGVDVIVLGGTKNGLALGEAVVFFDRALAAEFDYRVKQAGQLCSKMRTITAPWLGLLEGDVWLKNARHANAMARRLADRIGSLRGVHVLHAVEANAVFADLPVNVQKALRDKGWRFYTFVGVTGCRLMCAWDTAPETVDAFARDLEAASRRPG